MMLVCIKAKEKKKRNLQQSHKKPQFSKTEVRLQFVAAFT